MRLTFFQYVFPVQICINNLFNIYIIYRVTICTFLFAFWDVLYLDFAMFNDNLFILSHTFIFKSSSFIKDSKLSLCMLSLKVFYVLDKVVSSA